jgi:Zn finger protein HypA/HybF involved in hydrogenase expression
LKQPEVAPVHELSIATEIIELIESLVPDPKTFSKVAVTASPLSGISAEALTFCFDELCKLKGYIHATIEMTTVAVLMKCLKCGKEYDYLTLDTFCPECGKTDRDISNVNSFKIDYIETVE